MPLAKPQAFEYSNPDSLLQEDQEPEPEESPIGYDKNEHEIEIKNFALAESKEKEKEHVDSSSFELIKVLGQGSFGKVMLVKKKTGADKGAFYAMKVLKKAFLKVRDRARTKAERDILVEVRHPFIVHLHYAFQTEGKVYLIMDFLRGGDLFTKLAKEIMFTEQDVKFYLAELALAIAHLHSLGIIYRDLKPENIMLDDEGHVQLTDFGLIKEYHEEEGKAYSFCGTVEYMAPEVVSRKGHDVTCDWWSFGVLMYEMLTGDLPFHADDRRVTMQYILTAKLSMPPFLSAEAQSLLRCLFKRIPTSRLGFNGVQEIQAHPFFASVDWKALYDRQIPPPFKPAIANASDDHYFDHQYTQIAPSDSPAPPLSAGASDVFRGFSFIAPSVVEKQNDAKAFASRLEKHPRAKSTPISNDYDIKECIGEGSFSSVHRAIHRASGKVFSVKIIDKAKKNPWDEIEILLRYRHPNIVQMLDVYDDGPKAYLVCEILEGGELLDQIRASDEIWSEQRVCMLFTVIMCAVAFLHAHEVVHRDLKPSNILFADPSHSPQSVRLIDLGFAKQLTSEQGLLMTPCYTAQFVAPEVLKRQGYDKACDIWSLGILLYSMLSASTPFEYHQGDGMDKILGQIEKGSVVFHGKVWDHVSEDAKSLIRSMVNINPVLRPSANEVLRSRWVSHVASLPTIALPLPCRLSDVKHAVDAAVKAVNKSDPVSTPLAPVNGSLLARRRKSKSDGHGKDLPKLAEE